MALYKPMQQPCIGGIRENPLRPAASLSWVKILTQVTQCSTALISSSVWERNRFSIGRREKSADEEWKPPSCSSLTAISQPIHSHAKQLKRSLVEVNYALELFQSTHHLRISKLRIA